MRLCTGFLVAIFPALLAIPALQADDAKPVEGTLSMGGKPYKLLHAVAYETEVFDKPAIGIVASDRPINMEVVKKAVLEGKGKPDVFLRQTHVRVVFEKAGKISSYYATAAGFTTNGSGDALTGAMKLDGGRVTGQAKLESQGKGELQRSFEFTFAAGLVGSASEPTQQTVPLAKLGVSGVFKGNGKAARLAFVSARSREPFGGKPGILLVFTERDHSKDPRPDIKAGFGDFGSALIISCHEDGEVFGCEVAHSAHAKGPFSSLGKVELTEFQIAKGQVQGKVSTGGEVKAFDQTWEANLEFAAPFAASSKSPDTKTPDPKTAKPDKPPSTKPTPPADPKPAASLNVKDLAILQGVENIEYKKLVGHVSFASPSDYKALTGELAKKLETQGWTKDGNDVIGVSAILKRKRGEASLTIFVKPAAEGSQVTIFTKGLSWDP